MTKFRQADIRVDLIDHMGSDLTVVNAARVSFAKESSFGETGLLTESDQKLVRYLSDHNHWSPFAHAQVQFRVSAPIFVSRQLVKHQVGLVWNEVSRRYVSDEPTYYYPDSFRGAPVNKKQGSDDSKEIGELFVSDYVGWMRTNDAYEFHIMECHNLYMAMIKAEVAPEIARSVLPLSAFTEWYWTGSLFAFARVCKERLDGHAQKETREVAKQISDHMIKLFPVSWVQLVTKHFPDEM